MSERRLNPSFGDVDCLIFLHRRQILARWLASLPDNLVVLDVGGRIQPYRPLIESRAHRYIGVDLQLEGMVDVVADAERLPFANNCIDVVICTDTLQYVSEPGAAIREMHRVLQPGGKLILSARGCYPEHHDEVWRFLPSALRHECRMFSSLEIVPEGYSGSGLMITINVLLHRKVKSSLVKRVTSKTTIPMLNRLGLLLDRGMKGDSRSTCGFSLLGTK